MTTATRSRECRNLDRMIENTKKEIEALHKLSEQIAKEIGILEDISRNPTNDEDLRSDAKDDVERHKAKLEEIASKIRGVRIKLKDLRNHRLIECGR